MQLKSMTYTSRARLDLDDTDVNEIYQAARHLNALDGITGLLLFDGVRFLQIVEGVEAAVDDLMARLRHDPRHSAIEVRDERAIDARSFADWSMELFRVSPGYGAARREIGQLLPEDTTPAVRELILRMADAMADTAA
ncbi:blue-light sensor BLUF [Sphingomonas sp. DBB INV C78]|uniref:BLUF domain-containing protein n=1 Tax=Sphingomonas sp. DBB INV C78 TaxID=3349434 RepID=UPI0036D2E2A4